MSKSLRDAYGDKLKELGEVNENIVVLDADVSGSTKTAVFAKAFPERFYNVGIAEANMTAMAAGLSTTGYVPFVNTFAIFICTNGLLSARELISYNNMNVKLMGAYGGLSDAFDGPTHHSIEDMAIMRALPNMQVLCPCDESQAAWLTEYAANHDGPMYVRLSRDAMPDVYDSKTNFEVGKANIVRDGKDATVFACGIMVGHAIQAAEELEKEGISVRVVDMFSIKPIDKAMIERCAKETKVLVSAEEHSVIGGLGGAVSEVLAEIGAGVPLTKVGMQDCYAECGPYQELLAKYGLDAAAIKNAVSKAIKG